MLALLKAVYPSHNWQAWDLKSVPQGFWSKQENINRYMEWYREQKSIQNLEGFYNQYADNFLHLGGSKPKSLIFTP